MQIILNELQQPNYHSLRELFKIELNPNRIYGLDILRALPTTRIRDKITKSK